MAKTYNIFISHSWAYTGAYEKLTNLLEEKSYFSFKDYSVPRNDPIHNAGSAKELSEAIKRQMRLCNVIVIMAGVYSSYSRWINKEIKIAKNEFAKSKPIIAVKPWGNTNISQVVADNCDALVGWNTDSIVDAIRRLSQ